MLRVVRSPVSSFGFWNYSLFNSKGRSTDWRERPGWVGSWRAPTTSMPCIGTMNLIVGRNLFGVPPSGGPDRLKPGHQTVGSWKARWRFQTDGQMLCRIPAAGGFIVDEKYDRRWPITARLHGKRF